MNVAIMVIIVMSAVGIIFGFVLAIANKKFALEINPLIHIVEDALPKGQCGACGYAGCAAYAEAVVMNPEVAPNLCVPGKEAVAKIIADLTGKANEVVEPRVAYLKCSGTLDKATRSFRYKGIEDCVAANLIQGGPKGCKYGCIGFGTCVKSCPFNAMTLSEAGLPIIDDKICTGCGTCVSACPKNIIEMKPVNAIVGVRCSSKEKGAISRKLCTSSCIGCGLCAKNCSYGAVKVENNVAVVDAKVCIEQCKEPTCITKCSTKAIHALLPAQ